MEDRESLLIYMTDPVLLQNPGNTREWKESVPLFMFACDKLELEIEN